MTSRFIDQDQLWDPIQKCNCGSNLISETLYDHAGKYSGKGCEECYGVRPRPALHLYEHANHDDAWRDDPFFDRFDLAAV
jgi:hypothetical protein